jgi:hypothetical protein
MQELYITASQYTPEIRMNSQTATIEITGKSYPENTFEFYTPVLEWLEEYFQNPKEETLFNMEIIYFNSSSSKLFFDLFDLLEEHISNSKITIYWIYDVENETAQEAGEEFQEDFENLNIILKEKSE